MYLPQQRKLQLLIRWEHYDEAHDSWEPLHNFKRNIVVMKWMQDHGFPAGAKRPRWLNTQHVQAVAGACGGEPNRNDAEDESTTSGPSSCFTEEEADEDENEEATRNPYAKNYYTNTAHRRAKCARVQNKR